MPCVARISRRSSAHQCNFGGALDLLPAQAALRGRRDAQVKCANICAFAVSLPDMSITNTKAEPLVVGRYAPLHLDEVMDVDDLPIQILVRTQ